MANTINSGSLQGLQVGQTLLVSARKVAGNKLQLEFAEIVKTQSTAANPLAIFNKSDDRFSQGNGARRAWLTAEAKDASVYLNINLMDDDLVTLIEKIMLSKLKIGKEIGVISYNETPLKKIILNGITTISTDFEAMGIEAANIVKKGIKTKTEVPFRLTPRASL